MIVVIMQPTYLPWLGYLDLVDQSDVFVLLDTVAFSRQSWQQRNRILTPQGPRWLTVPVRHQVGQPIIDVEIDTTAPWRRKHWGQIDASYRRAPFWETHGRPLAELYSREWTRVCELNLALLERLCELAELRTAFVRASELSGPSAAREQRLIDICRALGADTYLSPLGSLDYLEHDTGFERADIALRFQTYEPVAYPQSRGGFVSHLSSLDALVQVGPRTAALVRAGRRPGRTLAQALMARDGPAG